MTLENHPWRTALLDSSLDCVVIMDATGRIVDLNVGNERTFGITREQVIGQRLGDVFVPPELRARHEAGLRRYLETRTSAIIGHRVEVVAMHSSGRRIPVELSIVQLSGVEPPLFVGHLRDITDRQRSERRLKASAAASRALAIATTPATAIDGVLRAIGEELHWHVVQLWRVDRLADRIVLDASWIADGVDPAPYQTVRELRRGQGLPGTVWADGASRWIEDVQREAPALPRFQTFTEAGVGSAVCFPVHASGITFAAIEAFALQPELKDPQLLVLLEAIAGQLGHVSAERAARDAIERSETALRDALRRETEARQLAEEANAGKDQFLAVISHELRTPLGPIMGWARLLQTSEPTPDLRAKATAVILRNAELQSRLVEDLLDVSRMAAGKLVIEQAPVSIVHVVHAAMETVGPMAVEKGVQVRFDGEFEVPVVRGDVKRLQQVMSNLLSNSIKFTPAGGQVTTSVQCAAGEIEIVVRDTGEGIDPAFLPYVFERFSQASQHATARAGGLGLGLAIVKDLVTAHGGSIRAESAGRGTGAAFTIRLPILHNG